MLNWIWLGFFLSAFCSALVSWLIGGNSEIFTALVQSLFDMSKLSFEIALGLVGVLSLWMGILKIAEHAGLVKAIAWALSPLFSRLMPDIPKGHESLGHISMNFAANMLGLDNAATPVGLKAMQSMQSLNPDKDTASNPQILFLVLNTSSVTLFPITVLMYRAQQGAADPSLVFLPILLATSASTLAGLLAVSWIQKLKLLDKVVLAYLGGFALCIGALIAYLAPLPPEELTRQSSLIGNLMLFSAIILFLVTATYKRINVYESFIDGAKEGFNIALTILPYLLAMIVAIGLFRTSGLLDSLLDGIRWICTITAIDPKFVDAIPTAIMKPLSGSGARAMMIETMNTHGVDSFAARVAATIQGSTETTFYVLAVYFGSVGIKRIRHALSCGLIADLAGVITAILVGYWFYS